MKIYIHTDLEGISGITLPEQVALYNDIQSEYSVKRLMSDVNAAIDGAFAGGASHVTVLDSHRGGNNFNIAMLDSRAEFDTRANGKWWGKLDSSYNGTLYIGAHAMAGAMNAFLNHTCNLNWHNYMINGRCFGELGMWAMAAGHFDVPMLMVSGDLAACQEAACFFNPVKTAVVKYAGGISEAESLEPDAAEELIRKTARESLKLIGVAKPFKPILPMEIRIEYSSGWGENTAEKVSQKPGVERLDGRTVRRISNSLLDFMIS